MSNKILLIFIFLSFFSLAKAEIVKNIIIDGNKRVSDETIKVYGQIELNKNIEDKDLDRILKRLYETEFFEDIKIELRNNNLKIVLKEYPIVNQLVIVGEKSNRYKDQIKKIIKLKEKKS